MPEGVTRGFFAKQRDTAYAQISLQHGRFVDNVYENVLVVEHITSFVINRLASP